MSDFPPSMSLVTVTCHFHDFPNITPNGQVKFTSPVTLQGPVENTIVKPFSKAVLFNQSGDISIDLPACNDPDWSPSSNWVYKVEITSLGHYIAGKLFIPYDQGPVNLAAALNIHPPAPGHTYVQTSALGASGGVPSLGSDGYIPDSQLRFPSAVLEKNDQVPDDTRPGTLIFRKQQ